MAPENSITSQDSTGIRVNIDSSHVRQTPDTSFGQVLATGLSRAGDAVMQAGNIAAPFVPGGAVLSAAVSGVGSLRASAMGGSTVAGGMGSSMAPNSSMLAAGGGGGLTGIGGATQTGGVTGTGGTSVDSLAASGNSQAVLQKDASSMQEMNQSFNLQYLMLQENMQQEQRQFSLMSNIMKTRHDGAKNVINNVR